MELTSGFAQRLKALREERGLTAASLALRIDSPRITRQVISNLENGFKKEPSISDVFLIAGGLRVGFLDLLVDSSKPWSRVEFAGMPERFKDTFVLEFLEEARLTINHNGALNTLVGHLKVTEETSRYVEYLEWYWRGIEQGVINPNEGELLSYSLLTLPTSPNLIREDESETAAITRWTKVRDSNRKNLASYLKDETLLQSLKLNPLTPEVEARIKKALGGKDEPQT